MKSIVLNILRNIEIFVAVLQGKGYGTSSLRNEVGSVLSFIDKIEPLSVIDVGANKGLYIDQYLIRNIKLKRVVLVEPSSLNCSILKDKCKKNDFILIKKAVSDELGKSQLYSDAPGSGLASLTKRNLDFTDIDYNFSESVEITTLDTIYEDLFEASEIVDILKLDIEGYELAALNGAKKLLANTKFIQFEFGGANLDTHTSFKDFFYFFQSYGWSIFRITPLGLEEITIYREIDEIYRTTNYIAVNNSLISK